MTTSTSTTAQTSTFVSNKTPFRYKALKAIIYLRLVLFSIGTAMTLSTLGNLDSPIAIGIARSLGKRFGSPDAVPSTMLLGFMCFITLIGVAMAALELYFLKRNSLKALKTIFVVELIFSLTNGLASAVGSAILLAIVCTDKMKAELERRKNLVRSSPDQYLNHL